MTTPNAATISLLERGRESINTRVNAARRANASIDEGALLVHVGDVIAPIVDSVGAHRAEAGWPALNSLIDASLNLFAANQLGPRARSSLVRDVWVNVLPQMVPLIAINPRRVIAALSNAAVNLAATPSVRAREWIERLPGIAALASDVDTFLSAAQIAAWRAGMVQYRSDALNAARSLPATLARAAMRMDEATVPDRGLPALIDAMLADPWLDPMSAGQRALRIVATVGSFRGFGGDFLRPPTVALTSDALLASDGTASWSVLADRFGQMLVRHGPALARIQPPTNDLLISAKGEVVWKLDRAHFEELAGASSWASDGQTLAVAVPTSHRIFLLSRTSADAGGEYAD